jgi:hypothetical protein
MRRSGQLLGAWLGIGVVLAASAFGEDAPRRVGFLNYISGDVTWVPRREPGEPNGADQEDWQPAAFNQPVCQDMSLKTAEKARARVNIGPDAIEMSDDTRLNMLNLTEQLFEASLTRGRINLQLAEFDPGESVEIETPRGSLSVLQAGGYYIDVGTGDQPIQIVVFDGKAQFFGGATDLPIAAGKEVQVTGNYPGVAATESDWTGIIRPSRRRPESRPLRLQTPRHRPARRQRRNRRCRNAQTALPLIKRRPLRPMLFRRPRQTGRSHPRRPPPRRQPIAAQYYSAHQARRVGSAGNTRHRYRRFRTKVVRRISRVGRGIQRGSTAANSASIDPIRFCRDFRVRCSRPLRSLGHPARFRAGVVPDLRAGRLGPL